MDQSQTISRLKIIHFAIVTGVVVFVLISIFLSMYNGPFLPELLGCRVCLFLMLAVNVFIIFAISLVQFYFNRRMIQIKGMKEPSKLGFYASVYIIRLAVIELCIFFFLTAYLLFAKGIYVFESVLLILLMLYFYPSIDKMNKDIIE